MPVDRYFIEAPLQVGQEIVLGEEEAHHLLHVTRTRVGEGIELINGKNVLASGIVSKVGRALAHVEIVAASTHPSPERELILAQALPRPAKLDLILEKGTECGITTFMLFPGERSEKAVAPALKRGEKVMISALKQCGRLDLPQLKVMPPLFSWEKLPPQAYFGSLEPEAPFFSAVRKQKEGSCFFIGPEGGFSEREVAFLQERGALGVRLGRYILRTETAALAAVVLMAQH